jgi:hypothetical protein
MPLGDGLRSHSRQAPLREEAKLQAKASGTESVEKGKD